MLRPGPPSSLTGSGCVASSLIVNSCAGERKDVSGPGDEVARMGLPEAGPLSRAGSGCAGFGSWGRSDRLADARAYLGARRCVGHVMVDGVDPQGTTPAARSLLDSRQRTVVAHSSGAGRKGGPS